MGITLPLTPIGDTNKLSGVDSFKIFFLQSEKQSEKANLWQKRIEELKGSLEKTGCTVEVAPVSKALSDAHSNKTNPIGHFFLYEDLGLPDLKKLSEWPGPLVVSISENMEFHPSLIASLPNISWVLTESGVPKENDFPWISFPSHDFAKHKAALVYSSSSGHVNTYFTGALADHDWKIQHIKPVGPIKDILEMAFSAKAVLFEDLSAGNDYLFLECLFHSQKIIINDRIIIPDRYKDLVLKADFNNSEDLREKLGDALNNHELNSTSKQTVPMMEGAQKIFDLYKTLE
ncbi:MAG: hypothetical protein V4736_07735 [Bdellovibrionota bacterium]